MATTFPTALDALTNPVAGDQLSSGTVPHATQHANANDTLEAIEAKLGIGPSAQQAAINTILGGNGPGTSSWRQLVDADVATGTLTPAKLYRGASDSLENVVINGGFRFWQRGTSFALLTANAYLADRWQYGFGATSGIVTITQSADVPTVTVNETPLDFSLLVTCTTADAAVAAGDNAYLSTVIEGYNARDCIGRGWSVSFWIKATKTGTQTIAFRGISPTFRSYCATVTINAANTWEYKTIIVPWDATAAAGTWDLTNSAGIFVFIPVIVGSTLTAPAANSWQAGSFIAAPGQINHLDAVNNTLRIAGLRIVPGGSPVPFAWKEYTKELLQVQRYFCKTFPIGTTPAQNSGSSLGSIGYINSVAGTAGNQGVRWPYPVRMRAVPTITTYSPGAASSAWYNVSLAAASGAATPYLIGDNACMVFNPQVAGDTAGSQLHIHATAQAEL